MTATLQGQNKDLKSRYTSLFKVYEEGLNGKRDYPISQFRQHAFKEFESESFPTRRDEDWKYTSVTPILNVKYTDTEAANVSKQEIASLLYEELDSIKIVFVNGVKDEELTEIDDLPHGLNIYTVEQALKNEKLGGWIEEQVSWKGGTDRNTFLPFNRAFADQGLVITIDKNIKIDRPVHLIYVSKNETDAFIAHPQLFVLSEKGSDATIIESFHSLTPQSTYFNNVARWIDIQANANLNHYKLQNEGTEAFQINNMLVRQDRDSVFSSYAIDLGGNIIRNNISTHLKDSGTETHLYGVYLGNDNQHIDNQTFIDHAVPHCQSNELYKGILTDKSKGVFNGKVLVRQDAQKTNAFQQNNSLVLSPTAVMDAKPQLEIYADDVRCSHGATIGQLSEQEIFYLRSRGIPRAQALNLLQIAFLGEVLENMGIDVIHDRILQMIEDKLNNK